MGPPSGTIPGSTATGGAPSLHLVDAILDMARWAPSGDNTQPWRFEPLAADHVVVHGFDTRDHCVYDLDGRASQLAMGVMLETLRLAATTHGVRVEVRRRAASPETQPVFDVRLRADAACIESDLVPFIVARSVQRRALSTRRLTIDEKTALEASVGDGYTVRWFESWAARWAVSMLTWSNAKIRLTIPEAFEVHRTIIEWGSRYSEDRIPDQAVGLDPLSLRLMRWLFRDWRRVDFFNRVLAGTIPPRIQLDLIPGLACAAHHVILAREPVRDIDTAIEAGRAVQRFWLTATRLGLQQQPEMTPLIFARYARHGIAFTRYTSAVRSATILGSRLEELLGQGRAECAVWMGRLGEGSQARARSVRLDIGRLKTTDGER